MIKFLFFALFIGQLIASPQDTLKLSNARHISTNESISNDSVSRLLNNLRDTQLLNSKLLEILERTNQQLSLVYNPYGLMVATLGILFTFLAIIVTFLIFRQSSDYRKLIDKSIQESHAIVNQFLSERKLEIETQMDQYKKEFETADADTKKKIEASLESLEKRKEYIDTQFRAPIAFGSSGSMGTSGIFGTFAGQPTYGYSGPITVSIKQLTCPHCKNVFEVSDSVPLGLPGNIIRQRICPHCKKMFTE